VSDIALERESAERRRERREGPDQWIDCGSTEARLRPHKSVPFALPRQNKHRADLEGATEGALSLGKKRFSGKCIDLGTYLTPFFCPWPAIRPIVRHLLRRLAFSRTYVAVTLQAGGLKGNRSLYCGPKR